MITKGLYISNVEKNVETVKSTFHMHSSWENKLIIRKGLVVSTKF